MNPRYSLLSLLLGGLALGMTEFMPMGLLPQMAQALQVTIPQAGHLISAYAIGVVIGAPVLVGLGDAFPPRKVLVALMLMFAICNALFAISPTYELLFVTRLFAGLPHGAFFGLGAVVATRVAGPGRGASAVATMFAGLTLANIVGVPLGTWLGHASHWRVPFLLVAAVAGLTAWAIVRWIPELPISREGGVLAALRMFAVRKLWLIIGISAIGTGGIYAWISYIAPLVTEVTGIPSADMSGVMMLAGLGMALGNWLGGQIADRTSPLRATMLMMLAMAATSVVVALCAHWKVPTLVLTFVAGAVAFSMLAPLQMVMIEHAPGSRTLASAMIQSTSNVGNALGAYLGGVTIAAGFGMASPLYAGAALALIGAGLAWILLRTSPVRAEAGPPAVD
ncbi:MFS transporter [Stenotrophomonas sp. MMGLT7]|uniref:MFS transporter n=1 Tax=Stenotrophomonas sp. MMGLT7 TaxID=2901227 RepID=UPI001E4F49DF|nr:MFS transporter [Stenotrophomonas sp. MMGLT7]MCD7100355.1 MFS transporter [Stenotrophomonas sp. MMGLT7]